LGEVIRNISRNMRFTAVRSAKHANAMGSLFSIYVL